MRVQLMTAMAVCLTVSACSGSKAPAISLDSKLKCSLVADAKMQGDNGTVVRLVNSAFEAAASDYKGDSDIEYYFQNAIRAEPATRSDVQRAVMNQCIADTGASISETFRKALTDSYEKNADKIYFASCKAFNDGVVDAEKVRAELARGVSDVSQAGLTMDSGAESPLAKATAACEANPSRRLQSVINQIVGVAEEAAQEEKRKLRDSAQADYVADTRKIIGEVEASIEANAAVPCAALLRIEQDQNTETAREARGAIGKATEASLARSSLHYAAAVRRDISGASLRYDDCAAKNWTLDQEIADRFGPDSIETAQKYLGQTMDSAVAEEAKIRSGQTRGSEDESGNASDEESDEMQMNRASRADLEDALYRERQAQELSN